MADANAISAQGAGKQSSWLLVTLIVLLFILAAAAAVGGTVVYMSGATDAAAKTEQSKPLKLPDPIYVAVEPFTVNLHDKHGRVLYIGVSLKVADKSAAERLNKHMPQVRNRILFTLTSQQADTLMTSQGKQALADAIRQAVAKPFNKKAEPLGVSNVLFTNFIVQ